MLLREERIMGPTYSALDGTRPRPPVLGALGYLLSNLPLGVAGFALMVTLFTAGLGTAIVWVGLPVLGLAVLIARAAGRFERARVHRMLGTYVVTPYKLLPEFGLRARWRARLTDGATWRDALYLVLLLPLGIAEFTIMVVFWSVGLAATALPFYCQYLPGGAYFFPSGDARWIVVDSPVDALPWAALGLGVVAVAISVTRALGTAHALFARAMLGPGPRARRLAESATDQPNTVA
ncbi:sensor domain-containing protein [Amycolatopsis thermalba]|uniref:Sensor domain-containing protein n=2 Tax=Pseudonocardiaceae TaxID=2070 RepID=A0ABY4NRX9_9PSEU|nr:sensor domain-containing protein [Amycolatopsis thermalba]